MENTSTEHICLTVNFANFLAIGGHQLEKKIQLLS